MKSKVKKVRSIKRIIISAGLFAGFSVSQADLIVRYDGSSASGSAAETNANVSASFISSSSWTIKSSANNFVISQTSADTIPTGAVNTNQYLSFSINPLGNTINFTNVTFDFGGENTMAATVYNLTIQLRSSVDGYASVLGSDSRAVPSNTTTAVLTPAVFDLSGVSALQNRTNTTQFRIYVYDDSTVTTKTLRARVDNIIANGSVIPEPTTIGMLGLGSLIAVLLRRMRS